MSRVPLSACVLCAQRIASVDELECGIDGDLHTACVERELQRQAAWPPAPRMGVLAFEDGTATPVDRLPRLGSDDDGETWGPPRWPACATVALACRQAREQNQRDGYAADEVLVRFVADADTQTSHRA